MHFGNLSFVNDGSLPLSLAPAYDMLPMHFAPRSSGQIVSDLPAIAITAEPALPVWREMLPLTQDYWRQVASSPQVGDDFREIARAMGARLRAMQALI